jgi:hypothetical protein
MRVVWISSSSTSVVTMAASSHIATVL